MPRTVFNRHKLKRTFSRRSQTVFDLIKGKQRRHSAYDFSWEGEHQNPFVANKRRPRGLWYTGIIALCALSTIAIFLFHPYFRVYQYEIKGLQRIEKTDIENSIRGILNYKTFAVFPHESYFLIKTDEIRDILKEKYPISSIVVQKTFPNTLSILIEEKISTVIYDNGIEYSYVDLSGKLVEKMYKVGDYEWDEKKEITTSTDEFGNVHTETKILERTHKPDVAHAIQELGDYPLVYDTRHIEKNINEQTISAQTVSTIIAWYNELHRQTQAQPLYFSLEKEVGELNIRTRQGWYIKTNVERSVDKQIDELRTLLKNELRDKSLQYVDLRYEGRVFWQ